MSLHSRITNKTTDGFNNVFKSIGSQKDVTTNTTYSRNPYISLDYNKCNGLYTNSLAGKAVDIPVEDAFRGGRELIGEDTDTIEDYNDYLDDICIDEKLMNAMKWSKIFGSAVLVIVSEDDEMDQPLIVDNIKKGDVKRIIALDRWQMYSTDINRNPLDDSFLEPYYYYATRTSTAIHHTRVIKLDGLTTTLYDKEVLNGWGLSIYERLYKDIMNAQMSPDLLINLLVQSNLDVFHLENFNDTLTNNDDLITKRLQYAQMGKSVFNGLMLDKEDNYTNIAKNFSGLDSIHDIFINLVCGSAEIPKTRFMGEQSAGLGNEGAGDMKIYYDRIEAKERNQLRKVYNYLDPILTKSRYGEVLDFDFTFGSLFQMTDAQKSEIRNKDAQTNQIYMTNGVITPLEAKESLIKDDLYSTITSESVSEESDLLREINSIEDPYSESNQ